MKKTDLKILFLDSLNRNVGSCRIFTLDLHDYLQNLGIKCSLNDYDNLSLYDVFIIGKGASNKEDLIKKIRNEVRQPMIGTKFTHSLDIDFLIADSPNTSPFLYEFCDRVAYFPNIEKPLTSPLPPPPKERDNDTLLSWEQAPPKSILPLY